jgi:hypothetical protein
MKRAGFLHWANTSRLLAVVRLYNVSYDKHPHWQGLTKKTLLNGSVSFTDPNPDPALFIQVDPDPNPVPDTDPGIK